VISARLNELKSGCPEWAFSYGPGPDIRSCWSAYEPDPANSEEAIGCVARYKQKARHSKRPNDFYLCIESHLFVQRAADARFVRIAFLNE
jgi:hypothetical protein